jgi:LuxR family quorum-sensing transcriptional regulator LasR
MQNQRKQVLHVVEFCVSPILLTDKIMISLDLVLDLFNCTTEEAWAGTLYFIASHLGFTHVLYGGVPNKLFPLQRAFIKSNYPQRWRRTYDEGKLHSVDPTVSHCMKSGLPIAWKPETFVTPEQKNFYEEASGYGLRAGVSLPAHGSNGEFGMLSFATDHLPDSRTPLPEETNLADLALVRDYAFESSLKFLDDRREESPPVRLTCKERECLQWVVIGKSSWEISKLLNCSEATINFHIANIKSKFNVRTRQQAVVKAISQGLIVPA